MKCLELLKNVFFTLLIFSCYVLNVIPLTCVSMNNEECKIRPVIINVNSNEPLFYPCSILANKWSGSFSNINDPYAKLCVPDFVQNVNVRVFNLMSIINEARHIKWHETCKCKRRLDTSSCNNKKRIKINVDVNAKNWLTEVYVINDLFGILVNVNVKVINHVIKENV